MEHQFKQHYATVAVAAATKMIESKVFGPDSLFASFKLDRWHTELNQFCSVILYGTMTVSDRDCRDQSHPLVFKFKHLTPEMRAIFKNDQQFHNEKLFYAEIAPFLLSFGSLRDGDCPATPSLCRYFYGRNDCGDLADQDLIVLQNETVRGYRSTVTDHTFVLDFDHLVMAIRTMAKFHCLSYRAKHVNRVKFIELVAKVKEAQWSADGEWYISGKVLEGLFSNGLDALVKSKSGYEKQAQMFRTELLPDAIKTLKRVMEPDEQLSVLCHNDFGRQNVLFRYDSDGQPLDALVHDMATIRYGSPALDLSYFMYLNMDRQTRDDHLDDLLDVYCKTLASAAGSAVVPDRSQLDSEIREHAFHGLAFAAMGSRMMFKDDQNPPDSSKLFGLTDDEALQLWLSWGGQRSTEWTVDVIQHYLDMTYTDKVAD